MAVADIYNVAAGLPVHAGRTPVRRPAWRRAMAPNTWAQIPATNTLDSLNPQLNPAINPVYPGRPEWMKSPAGHNQIIGAWCGACLDRNTDTLWLPLSGGHADYGGNEPYRVRLDVDAPTWEMVRPPTGAIGNVYNTDDIPVIQPGSTTTALILSSGANAPYVYGGKDEASSVDGAYVGDTLELVQSGQTRTITAYNGATKTATVNTAFTGTVVGYQYGVRRTGVGYVHGRAGEMSGRYADGNVRAIHSYNKPLYIPDVGPVIVTQGGLAWSGQSSRAHMVFIDPVTGDSSNFGAENTVTCSGSCYDRSRHAVWARSSGTAKFSKYDIRTNIWTEHGILKATSGNAGLCHIPDDDCVVWLCGDRPSGPRVLDCATNTLYEPTTTGSTVGCTISGSMQPHWVPSLNAVAVWDNSSSTTVINLLNKPSNPRTGTWTISQLPVAAGNTVTPTAKTSNGTFGRFQYSPRLNGFYVLNATNQPIYFYALD